MKTKMTKKELSEYRSARMKINNPMWKKGSKEKMVQTLKRINFKPKKQGGNGRKMPIAQEMLSTALGKGWVAEYPVNTGFRPPCFKLDIANPKLKIGIEVDGRSHNCLKRKDQDTKKELFLESIGWEIFRIKNSSVENNLERIVEEINEFI